MLLNFESQFSQFYLVFKKYYIQDLSMQQIKQDQLQFAQKILQLFKQRAKEQPEVDHSFQALLKSSQLKQDYIEVADRISLSKKNNTNILIQILQKANETGKYGLRVDYLSDTNKSCQERLRIYVVELNKYLKESFDLCSNIWESFKKMTAQTSFVKVEKQVSLKHYLNQIKSFKEDIQNNKYAVTKVGKIQSNPSLHSHKSQIVQKRQADKSGEAIHQIKQKLTSIYNSCSSVMPKKDLPDYEINHILEAIKKNILEGQNVKLQFEQLKKKNELKELGGSQKVEFKMKEPVAGSSAANEEVKDLLITSFIKVLQARKIQTLQQVYKQILNFPKHNDQLLLKTSFRLYIQEYNGRKEENSSRLQLSPKLNEHSRQLSIQQQLPIIQQVKSKYEAQKLKTEALLKQNETLLKQNTQLKNQMFRSKQQFIILAQKQQQKLLNQIKRLESELQSQRSKFSYLDRSGISMLSQQSELFNYQSSPQRRFQVQKTVRTPSQSEEQKDIPSPVSQNKTVVMLQCLKDYQKLQLKLRDQIKVLSGQNGHLQSEIFHLKDQFNQILGQIQLYKNKLQIQVNKSHLLQAQIRDLLTKISLSKQQQINSQRNTSKKPMEQSFDNQTKSKSQLQKLVLQQQQYQATISSLESQKLQNLSSINKLVQKIQEIKETLNTFFAEKQLYTSEINKKNKLIAQIQESIRQFHSAEDLYKAKIIQMQLEIQHLKQTNQQLQSQINIKQAASLTLRSQSTAYLQKFFIEQRIYKSQLLKKDKQINDLLELKEQLEYFYANQKIYQSQIQRYMEQINKLNKLNKDKDEEVSLLQHKIAVLKRLILETEQLSKNNRVEHHINQLSSSEAQSLSFQIVRLKQQVQHYRTLSLFSGQILNAKPNQRENLLNILQKQTGKQIQKTKLVYKLDPHSTVNFHNYVDDLEGLLVVVQTQKVVVGGFYEGTYGEGILQKPGFIFSLTKNQCYTLKEGKKAAFYDKFYLIIGNSQIRIKPERKHSEFFSNFGVSNSSFNSKGHNVNDFLQQNERTPKLVNFQIYHVIFAQASPSSPVESDKAGAAPK